jgi:Fic family protein
MFIRKKQINGKYYYFAVHSTRKDGKISKIERYIGKSKPTEKDLEIIKVEFDSVNVFLNSQKDILDKIREDYRKFLNSASEDRLRNHEEQLIVQFTYDSSRIEGSELTLKDTRDLLIDGISPRHKSSRDIRETENHRTAYLLIKNNRGPVDKSLILKLHGILKQGVTEDAGRFRDSGVRVGNLVPVRAEMIDGEIRNLLGLARKKNMHPIELATVFHCDFERIHPFFDGNGRVGRLLLNLMLMKTGYPAIIIRNRDRKRYYNALKRADNGNYLYMIKYVVQCLKRVKFE